MKQVGTKVGDRHRSCRVAPARTVGVAALVWACTVALTACGSGTDSGRAELSFGDAPPTASAAAQPEATRSAGALEPGTDDDGSPGPFHVSPTTRTVTEKPAAAATPSRSAKASLTPTARFGTPGRITPSGTADKAAVVSGSTVSADVLTLGPGRPSAAEAEVVRLMNLERTAAGCPALEVNPLLVQVARAHSEEMAQPDGFRHNSANGRTPFQRLMAAGYRYSIATENIAAGQPNAAAVFAAWTSSEESMTSMLDCRLTQIGVGVVNKPGSQYRTYWTQNLATPM